MTLASSSSFLFFVFFVVAAALDSGGDRRHILASSLENINNELLSDDSPIFEETNDGKVKMVSSGTAQLILTNGKLDVEVDLKSCIGNVLFCYNSSLSKSMPAKLELCSSRPIFCGFRIQASKTDVILTSDRVPKTTFDQICSSSFVRMEYRQASYCGYSDGSCDPAFDKENRITIEVILVSPQCPITILNAKVYVPPPPPPTTTSTSTSTSKAVTTSPEASKTEESKIWWLWIVIPIVVILLIVGIIVFVICYTKRSFKKKKQEELKNLPLTGITIENGTQQKEEHAKVQPEPKEAVKEVETKKLDVPKVKTPIKKEALHPPTSKVEQPKQLESLPKKEPTVATEATDEPLPPPQPPPPQLPPATPVTESKEPIVVEDQHEVPKKLKKQCRALAIAMGTSKSGSFGSKFRGRFKDSVESQRSINKKISFECHYNSMKRNGLLGGNSKEIMGKMAMYYKPDPKKKNISVEVSLLYNLIGDVFVTINGLVKKSIDELKKHGLKLYHNGDIKEMTSRVRKFLQERDTPEYIKFTCFALEYGHLVPGDDEHLCKYSMALLLVVAFTLNQPEESRRRALTTMRRELPFWRRESSIEERNAFGYPANAIEAAYQAEPKCFHDVKLVRTNSTPNASEEILSNSKTDGTTVIQSKEVVVEKPKSKSKSKKKKRH